MATPFPHLFAPLDVGRRRAKNRIVFGAHFTMFTEPAARYGEPGFFGERLGRYLERRASHDVGIVIAGQAHVHPTTAYQMQNNASAWDEAAIPHLARVAEPIRRHGALAILQLAHNGGVNTARWSRLPVWTPSHVVNNLEAPTPLEAAEIQALVAHFATSAKHAVAAGFDGVEIHGAHGYLIHEFLSPLTNRRTDAYGGSLENRMRFGVEVLRAVRDAVGADAVVGLRLVGDEEIGPRGLRAEDAAEIAARLESAGLVDFLDVSIGRSGVGMVRPVYSPHEVGVYAAATVKRAVRTTPVFAVQRILTPDEADAIVARGDADAVTVVRALIADEAWAAKARDGRADTIRHCTGINQGCYGNLTLGLPVTCVQNPAVGREDTLGPLEAAPSRRRGATRSSCSSARRGSAGRSRSRHRCPGAESSPIWPRGAPPSAHGVAWTCGSGWRRRPSRCWPSRPTPSSSRRVAAPPRTVRRSFIPCRCPARSSRGCSTTKRSSPIRAAQAAASSSWTRSATSKPSASASFSPRAGTR